jgi:hypothetical protein
VWVCTDLQGLARMFMDLQGSVMICQDPYLICKGLKGCVMMWNDL